MNTFSVKRPTVVAQINDGQVVGYSFVDRGIVAVVADTGALQEVYLRMGLAAKDAAETAMDTTIEARDATLLAAGSANEDMLAAEGFAGAAADSADATNQDRIATEGFLGETVQAKDAAQLAQQGAETAEGKSITAQGLTETARDATIDARDQTYTARDEAVTLKNQTSDLRDSAEAQASAAAGSASASGTSAGEAQESENLAKKWADETPGVEVTPGRYSARHHADNAATSETNVTDMEVHVASLEQSVESYHTQSSLLQQEVENSATQVAEDRSIVSNDKLATRNYRDTAEQHKLDAESAAQAASGALSPVDDWDASTDVNPPSPTDGAVPWYRISVAGTIPQLMVTRNPTGKVEKGDNIYWSYPKNRFVHIDNTERFTSINGYNAGSIVLNFDDVGAAPSNHSHGYSDLPISSNQVANWNNAHSWGDHNYAGYSDTSTTQEIGGTKTFTDPIVSSSTGNNLQSANTAFEVDVTPPTGGKADIRLFRNTVADNHSITAHNGDADSWFNMTRIFGFTYGDPTEGFKGAGTINAEGLFVNGNPAIASLVPIESRHDWGIIESRQRVFDEVGVLSDISAPAGSLVKFKFPLSSVGSDGGFNTVIGATIRLWELGGGRGRQMITADGHAHQYNTVWESTFASHDRGHVLVNTVQFAIDADGYFCILLGKDTENWSTAFITIEKLFLGWNGVNKSPWNHPTAGIETSVISSSEASTYTIDATQTIT